MCFVDTQPGSRDPFVAMSLADDWSHTTEVHQGAGDHSTWAPDVMIPVTSLSTSNPLQVMVKDDNSMAATALIGEASVDCSQLKSQPDKWVEVRGDLLDSDGKVAGQYSLKAKYHPDANPSVDDSNQGAEEAEPVSVSAEEAEPVPVSVEDERGHIDIAEVSAWDLKGDGTS